jgi:HK97 family phage portal protein
VTLRDEDHLKTLAFLGRLERDGAKALPAPIFSGYGGQGYGNAGGVYGSPIFQPWLPGAKADYVAEAGDTWRNAAVAICLGWRGDNLAEPEPVTERLAADGKTWEVQANHPLTRLLRKPNPYYGWGTLIKAWDMSWTTDGNAYWMLASGLDGMPMGIYPIPHFRIWPRWDTSGNQYIGWWDYQVDGRIIKLKPEAVVHFRDGVDPYYDRLGISPLKSNLREVCSDNQFAGYTAALARNMGVVPYVISPKDANATIDPDDQDAISERFSERTTGENRGKPLVSSGSITVDRLALSPEEMAIDKITRVPEARICACCKIPAQVVGLAVGQEMKTYANYSQARKAAYEDGLIPALKALATIVTEKLLPMLGDPARERFRFDFSKVAGLGEGQDAKASRFGDAYQKNRGVTLNEYRTQGLDLPPVPGGDKFADGSDPTEGPSKPAPPVVMGADGQAHADDDEPADEEETKALRAEAREVLKLARERMGA